MNNKYKVKRVDVVIVICVLVLLGFLGNSLYKTRKIQKALEIEYYKYPEQKVDESIDYRDYDGKG